MRSVHSNNHAFACKIVHTLQCTGTVGAFIRRINHLHINTRIQLETVDAEGEIKWNIHNALYAVAERRGDDGDIICITTVTCSRGCALSETKHGSTCDADNNSLTFWLLGVINGIG